MTPAIEEALGSPEIRKLIEAFQATQEGGPKEIPVEVALNQVAEKMGKPLTPENQAEYMKIADEYLGKMGYERQNDVYKHG